jgi:excisionase family DNA binding protein
MIYVDTGKPMKNLKDYITVKEAAEILGVSPLTLKRWDTAGKLKAYRHPGNGYRLYVPEQLKKFLKKIRK